MPVSIDDFWKLAIASELLSADKCAELQRTFTGLKGASHQANTQSLAQWLVTSGEISRYQAAVLAAGRPGPFVFGPFVITDRIEKGRLARYYRATFHGSRKVLLVVLSQLTDNPNEYQRLADTARAIAAVKSPHVSRTYQVVRHRSQSMIVVEGLEGESLEESLARQPIKQSAACQIGFQLALGLVALHSESLTHGCICPQNIWIDTKGMAKLLQFPLVPCNDRLKRWEPPQVDLLAPELAESDAPATPLSDIYALGCTLFELVAGRPVFAGGTGAEKVERHRGEVPQRLDELDPNVSEDLADVVAEMLEKDPLLRCQTASQAAHLLAPLVSGQTQGSRRPKLHADGLMPGYGAWKAPDWRSPPKEVAPNIDATGGNELQQGDAPPEAAIVVRTGRNQESADGGSPEVPMVVTGTDSASRVALPQRPPSKNAWIAVGAGLVLVLAVAVGAVVANRGEKLARESNQTDQEATASAADAAPPAADAAVQDEAPTEGESSASAVDVVDDNGETLWVSPTAGRPIDPAFLPSGAQVLLVLRPAELLSSLEGAKLLDAVGPGGQWAENELRATLGVEPVDIEQLIAAFVPDESHAPRAAMVMRLVRDIPKDTLLASWGNPTSAEHEGKAYFQGTRYAYFLPESGGGRLVAVAPTAMMKQILEISGPPLLRSGVERLLQHSDDSRQLTVLFTPSYLLTDGRGLLVGHLEKLRDPLREFLDESIEAVMVSAHVGQELFLEFRAVAPIDRKPLELLGVLRARYDKIPERVETHVASLSPHPHGRLVVNRFPRMMQLLRDYTRGGTDDGQIVMRAYLPASAAHNLAMGAELTLLESAGTVRAAPQDATTTTTPTNAAQSLKKKISLSFPRDSLDRVMDVLAAELDVEIIILGPDLQLEGITKNQSLGNVDERDQPADAILRKLLKLANPDGKLVYVIRPSESGGEAIFITTRQAAAKGGDNLPEGF